MDIKEFFEQSAGKWFSQRTSFHLALNQSESQKSTVIFEMLSTDTPEVVQLCQQHNIEPQQALCAAKITWEEDQQNFKRQGSTIVVPVPDADKVNQGRLLREMGSAQKNPVAGRYIIGNDQALTLMTDYETMYSEERLWFASPNLRLRTSTIKQADGFSMASLYSEIRMGVTAPPKQAEDAAAST